MKVIGLTGGISSGKSTVIKWFLEDGVPVLDADQIVRDLQQRGTSLLGQIATEFGAHMLLPDGNLNREALGKLIFNDETAKERLNWLIHPFVKAVMVAGIEEARNQEEPLMVLDVPLLYESGFDELVDLVVVVYVPREIQLERLMSRDQIDEGYALAKISSQADLDEKKSRADYVLDNSDTVESLRQQYERLRREMR